MESNVFSSVRTVSDRAKAIEKVTAESAELFSSKENHSAGRKKELDDMREQLLSAKVIRLTLAFDPDPELTTKISNKVREGAGNERAILDIDVDPAILAGVVLSQNGKLQDFSLQKKISGLQLENILSKHIPSLSTSVILSNQVRQLTDGIVEG